MDSASFVQLPRRGAYKANPAGSLALVQVSQYSLADQRTERSVEVVRIDDESEWQDVTQTILGGLAYAEAIWADDSTVLYLRPPGAGKGPDVDRTKSDKALSGEKRKGIELWAKELAGPDYKVGELPTEVSNLKWHRSSPEAGTLAFSAAVYPPYDVPALRSVHERAAEFEASQQGSTGQTFSSLFVRHWDAWKDQHGKESRMFVVGLRKRSTWSLSDETISAPMAKIPRAELPVGPFGDAADYDLGDDIFVCTLKDPAVNPAWHTRQEVYIVPLAPKNEDASVPRAVTSGGQGATSCPTLSPTAKAAKFAARGYLAWLEQATDGYESDRNVVVVMDLATGRRSRLTDAWDRSPTSIRWAEGEAGLWLKAEDVGRVKLFYLPLDLSALSSSSPAPRTSHHSVTGIDVLPAGRLLLTMSSFASPNTPYLFHGSTLAPLADVERLGAEGEDFWFDGDGGKPVHGFVLRPKSKKAKLPLAFLIHGGPQGAWLDSWSWRWNANVFTAAGYLTVALNPTGSTGYGQAFTDAINCDWGGAPYRDLVRGYEALLARFPEVDRDRTAALGASYGGYMVNWLMGHNPGFAAFVCHDGVFAPVNTFYATEELYFPTHDFRGVPWEAKDNYAAWDPRNHIDKWNTPCLVIHNDLDFRLPLSEGISAFNVLQRKGIPSKLLRFPDEGHWVNSPSNAKRWTDEVLAFIDEWTPASAKPSGYNVGYNASV